MTDNVHDDLVARLYAAAAREEELTTIALKKSIEYTISYQQSRMNTVARQLIRSAVPSFYFSDSP